MRISHRYEFIFFSNPKTGSESVRALLNPYSDITDVKYLKRTPDNPFYSHIRPVEMRALFEDRGWTFDTYRKFVFVRNPWARLVSLYKMIKRTKRFARLGFSNWLDSIEPNGIGGGGADHQRWRRYGTYSIKAFVGDDSGNSLVDDVIRLEDIDQDLPDLLHRIGISNAILAPVPHVNRGSTGDYRKFYTAEDVALVREKYSYDIDHFGYTFEQ